jgi:GNAT superfamily N-acetyltransferase
VTSTDPPPGFSGLPSLSSSLRICRADYANPIHASAVVLLLDAYARDAAGGGDALSDFAKAHLVKELAARPQAYSVLAFDDTQPVGLINCIEGFSTFACKPLVNVHDVAVLASHRGQRVAEQMLALAEQIARERGACRATAARFGCMSASVLPATSWTRRWAMRSFFRSGWREVPVQKWQPIRSPPEWASNAKTPRCKGRKARE